MRLKRRPPALRLFHHAIASAASAAAAPVRPGRAAAAAAGVGALAGAAAGNSLPTGTGASACGGWQLRYDRNSGCTCTDGLGGIRGALARR